jgi:SAM-dependent methyltransferase
LALNSKQEAEVAFWRGLFYARGRDGFLVLREEDLGRLAFCPEMWAEEGRGLDYGCGLVSVFEFSGLAVEAYDPLFEEYDRIYRHQGQVRYVAEPVGPYDYILCMNVADHTPEPAVLFRDLLDLLAPKGRLYFEVQFDPELYPAAHYQQWNLGHVRKHLARFELVHESVRTTATPGQISYEAVYRKPGGADR